MDSWEMDNTNITTSSLATTTTEPTQDAWRGTFPIISGVVMWACIILCAILCRRVCIECSDCFKRIFFKTRLFLAHTWPCSRCVDEPTPDDVSVDGLLDLGLVLTLLATVAASQDRALAEFGFARACVHCQPERIGTAMDNKVLFCRRRGTARNERKRGIFESDRCDLMRLAAK